MTTPETMMIDSVKYVREDSVRQVLQPTGDIKIVILPRGWNMVGHFSQEGSKCKLEKASVIRRWGTTQGLGELALKGPLADTILDPCPLPVEFHELTVIATMGCVEGVWTSRL